MDSKKKKLNIKEAEFQQLSKEALLGVSHDEQLNNIRYEIDELSNQVIELEAIWEQEKQWVQEAKSLRAKVIEENVDCDKERLQEIESNLALNTQPLVFSHVNESLIAEVISDWTGIPLGKLQDDEIEAVLNLKDSLCERVVGQDHALEIMSEVIKTASAQLTDETKPNGVFLLTGLVVSEKRNPLLLSQRKFMGAKTT